MNKVKETVQWLIGGVTAVFGGIYASIISRCKDCDPSFAEEFGAGVIFLLIVLVIIGFWLWLFSSIEIDFEDDDEDEEKEPDDE